MRTLIAAGLAVVLLAGCGGHGQETAPSVPPLVSVSGFDTPSATPSDTPSPTASATPADTVCLRIDETLVRTTLAVPVVRIQRENPPAELDIPAYDVCQLSLGTTANGPVLRIGVSVLQATAATLAAARKVYAAHGREPAVTANLGEGGYGTSTFVVFLLDGRLYKISGPRATLAKYVVLGQEVARQAPGLPAPALEITRPECDAGSAAAEQVMGVPATARRDGETLVGDPVCGWVTGTSVLYSTVRREPDAKALMAPLGKAATSQSIPLGDEGYIDTATGRTTIRVGDDKLVDLVPLPARAINPDLMTQFALALSSLYTH
ncbi:hypothetical protein JOF29_005558 [Kribbella aluminosa]|uniref:Uncharacterized protein n=1 Tax=Kribbella aluminosa TaxID=416017 RepID=A0ABS4US32_9ACTN|nr:hypothetical protein [Kribbella aluminosa]MBP2354448.1 hypothetical protein [Kribbella aluminosa]